MVFCLMPKTAVLSFSSFSTVSQQVGILQRSSIPAPTRLYPVLVGRPDGSSAVALEQCQFLLACLGIVCEHQEKHMFLYSSQKEDSPAKTNHKSQKTELQKTSGCHLVYHFAEGRINCIYIIQNKWWYNLLGNTSSDSFKHKPAFLHSRKFL